MRASKVNVQSKAAANMNGVTRSRRRQSAANVEAKKFETAKNNEQKSPNSNSENISPIPKKLRSDGKREQSVLDKTASPNAKAAVKKQKLDKSIECDSRLDEATTKRKPTIAESKIDEKREEKIVEAQADANKSLNESVTTPNTSCNAEKNGTDKSDRQLRSSGRKVANIFDTPFRKTKARENIETNKLVETPVSRKTATENGEASHLIETPVSENKATENVEAGHSNNVESGEESKNVDVEASGAIENADNLNHVDESVEAATTNDIFNETDQASADVSFASAEDNAKQTAKLNESKTEPIDISNEVANEGFTGNEKHAISTEIESEKQVNQEQMTSVDNIEVTQITEEISPHATDSTVSIPIDNLKSPSTASVDSAKGSSIGTDAEAFASFFTGDLFWGQIHHFCYWPCMVCPDGTDEENRIIRMDEQQMEVHVRFFADNARHSWVKRENLLRYLGLKQYKELTQDVIEKYGENSPKCKIFFPKRSKKNVWRAAVKEADDMANVPYEERLQTFFRINDLARERIKEEKLRRKSLSLAKSNPNLSLVSSLDTSDSSDTLRKRNRSESPVSPQYSPQAKENKRRKTTSETDRPAYLLSNGNEQAAWKQTDETLSSSAPGNWQLQQQKSQNDELFKSPEFKDLYDVLREYITRGLQCDLIIEEGIYRAVHNVWAMKQVIDLKIGESGDLTAATTPNKRLSSRLKDMQKRQQTQSVVALSTSPLQFTHPVPEKRRSSIGSKPRNRPMPEVIDDVFNLDKFYLFDNVRGRAPVCKYCLKPGGVLKRCARGCLSWLHDDCSAVVDVDDDDSEVAADKKTKHAIRRRASHRKSSIKSVDSSSVVHVTADDETTESDEDKQKSEKDALVQVLETTKEEEEVELIVCKECANDVKPQCFVCKCDKLVKSSAPPATTETTHDNVQTLEKEALHMCNMPNCGRAYHLSCLKYWPQAKTVLGSKTSIVSLRCPSHSCHTCVSDDPKGKFQQLKDANTIKCVKCPATYHMDSTCIPAGSKVLTAAHIICPRHGLSKSDQNVNVSWCFICVRGGKLICCETCPTAVHAECTNTQLEANENYICDECESGRLPLYGEMVWAKFNMYRWWPAIILPPTEVPLNIRNKPHNPFDFVIRFFGTHDHGWISRRRVYLYVEGDWSEPPRTRRLIDQSYLRGVIEAKETYEIIKAKTLLRQTENENKESLHPHPYVKIRVNRAVPPVKLHQDIEMASRCNCDPNDENPCGLDSDCLNRVLYHECNPKVCSAGDRCQNQMFESRISPALEVFYAKKERGFGLRCREAIKTGTFIIEYVGEVINSEEFQRRMERKSADRDENFYFLHVEKDYIIDAGPKGNMARFMNHSCDPNCETQKWSVNGLNRVGLFAIKDIPAKTELTFNYHWDELLGNDKKVCSCGSANCTGQIGKISKEEMKRKQEMEAANLSASKMQKITKLAKRRSSVQIKIKGINNKNDSQLTVPSKKQRNSLKSLKRASIASPSTKDKVGESNDNNNNI